MAEHLALIGFGEAGRALVQGWGRGRSAGIRVYDIKSSTPGHAEEIRSRYDEFGVTGCDSSAEAVDRATLVLSVVTADQALAAAEAAARHVSPGTIWCDLNSCAPSTKQKAAEAIGAAGGIYADVAVMSPVHPRLNMVPLLVSGDRAEKAAARLAELPMSPRVVQGGVGAASTIKLVRSVFVKGLESLMAELALSAAKADVEDEVFDSIARSHPDADWRERARHSLGRMLAHGERRAAEMDEALRMVEDLGLPGDMSRASAVWQRRIAAAREAADKSGSDGMPEADMETLLGAIPPPKR